MKDLFDKVSEADQEKDEETRRRMKDLFDKVSEADQKAAAMPNGEASGLDVADKRIEEKAGAEQARGMEKDDKDPLVQNFEAQLAQFMRSPTYTKTMSQPMTKHKLAFNLGGCICGCKDPVDD